MICISCENEHFENFCPNCGEESKTKKITLTSIIGSAFSTVTNMDQGFLFNLKSLTLNPQKITTNYILGKRKGILNPVSFLIISVTLYLIVMSFFGLSPKLSSDSITSHTPGHATGRFLGANIKYFWIFTIIPLALSTKLVFFKKFNYIENLAISSFIIGQATLVGIISYLFLRLPMVGDPIVYVVILFLIYRIFKEHCKKVSSFSLSFVAIVLFILQLFLIIFAVSYYLGDSSDI